MCKFKSGKREKNKKLSQNKDISFERISKANGGEFICSCNTAADSQQQQIYKAGWVCVW